MEQTAKHTFGKMNQDLAKSKFSPEVYYEGKNIRIITNEGFGGLTNEDGNELKLTLPTIETNPTTTKSHLNLLNYPLSNSSILGHTTINKDLYLLTKYDLSLPTAKLFYAQDQNVSPYIDSNIRILINGETFFENFDSTGGAVEGPALPTNTTVRVQSFHLATEPNQAAPDPTLYLEVYENGILINKQQASLDYINSVTLFYDIVIQPNKVYFFHAYSLPEPGDKANPFTGVNINQYVVDGDIFAIYKVDKNYTPTLLFFDTFDVETTKIDVVGFYESEKIQKLYWADGTNELRFANVADPNLIELNKKFLSTVPNVLLTQPKITGYTTGGSHTSGTIQYAYNLYKKNGAQTKISPLSSLAVLNNSDKGNDVNIQVDKAIQFNIPNIDTTFDRIRIYSVKYSTQNSLPKIILISEQDISDTSLDFTDDNNSTLTEITFAEFVALGGDIYYPKHLKIKDNHLFLFNYKTKAYDIDFDARAYRFASDGSLRLEGETTITSTGFTIPDVPLTHDAINPTNKAVENTPDFNKYVWKAVAGTTPADVIRKAYFNEVFEFVSTFNLYEQNYYDANDEIVIVPSDPSITYSNNRNLTYSTFNLNPALTFISASIEGGSDLLEVPLCGSATPNYPGDRQWQVSNLGGGQIQLLVQYTTDSRCTLVRENKSVEITVSDGVTTHVLSFTMSHPGGDDPNAQVQVSAFDSGTYTITDSNPPVTNGVLGGIGPNVEYEIKYRNVQSNFGESTMLSSPNLATVNNPADYMGLKSGEVYRLFIEFLLENGGFSFPKWVGDVKIPEIGDPYGSAHVDANGVIYYPYIETKLINLPTDSRVVGWRTAIVERTEYDRSVVTQGLYNSTIEDNVNASVDLMPSYLQRTVTNSEAGPVMGSDINKPVKLNSSTLNERNLSTNLDGNKEITGNTGDYALSTEVGLIYTPETILNKKLPVSSGRIRRVGLVKNTYSQSFREVYDDTNTLADKVDLLTQDFNITKEVVEPGARLLTNFIPNDTNSNSVTGRRNSKLISSGKDNADETAITRKRLAYTRYFGGVSYFGADSGSIYYTTIDNNIGFMSPIVNVFNIPFNNGASTKKLAGQGNILIKYPEDETTGEVFKFYGGSAIVITGGLVNAVTFTSELPIGDLDDYGILVEIYRVIPNQYGGHTYEARHLNKTIPYSNIVGMQVNTPTTEHQGDTYIQKFNFLKTFRADDGSVQISEIVSVPVETYVNLDLRWDILKQRPDNFEADENTSYGFNSAYSQKNTTIRNSAKPFNFEEIIDYPVNIIPSKKKVNNELIDSFTDFLINDVKSLDGQYGEITGVGEFKDNLFAFQRTATAYLAINPRVQLPTGDNIPIELGTGNLIERYQYLTTNSGTLNKWSIVKSTNGLMYVDLLTKSINFINADPMKITTLNGFYNKFLNYINANEEVLAVDNPILSSGVVTFYDKIKEDTYITFLGNTNLTIAYNGLAQGFVSFYDYFPKHYMNVDNRVITVNQLDQLWEHNKIAPKGSFYGTYYPSSITLVTNQGPDTNKIFNNLHFNSEFTLNGVDQSDITFTKLRVWNDYQDTTETSLDTLNYRTSIRRRLRKWNLIIPRDTIVARDRISNYWTYVKLEFDKTDLPVPRQGDYDFILQDLLISFTPKP